MADEPLIAADDPEIAMIDPETPEVGAKPDATPAPESMTAKFARLMADKSKEPAREPAGMKEPEKPAEPAPATPWPKGALDDEPPKNLSPKAVDSWKTFRQKANEKIKVVETEREALRLKVAELEKRPVEAVDKTEVESLRKQNQEFDQQLRQLAIERHPKFKAKYDTKIESAIASAKRAAGEHGAKVEKLLSLPENEFRTEQLEGILGELSPLRQAEFTNALARVREMQDERQAEIVRSAEQFTAIQRHELEEREKSASDAKLKDQEVRGRMTTVALNIAKQLDAFKPIEGDEDHNKSIRDREMFLKSAFAGKLDEKMYAAMPALASEALYLKESIIPKLQAEIAKRDAIISGASAASPRAAAGAKGGDKPAQPKGFIELLRESRKT